MQIDTMFGIPIFVLVEDMDLPKRGNFYVVASNGVFLHKDNGMMHTFVPVDGISCLQDFEVDLDVIQHSLASIPADLCYKVKTFFAKVVAKHQAESCVVLYYNNELKHYVAVVPRQSVSHGGVLYLRKGLTYMNELAGYVPVGTIHSHCDFQAYHSGVDDRDENDWDGLHITFGHNNQEEFTISSSIVMQTKRGKFDPLTIIEGIQHVTNDRYKLVEQSDEFKEQVDKETDEWLTQIVSYGEMQKLLQEASE